MADYSRIQGILMGQIQKVAAARQVQGLAYGIECVRRSMVDYRETGVPKVYPLTAAAAGDVDVEVTGGSRLFGVLLDNSAGGPFWLQLFNTNTPTLGTTVPIQTISIPGVGARFVAFATPEDAFTAALTWAVTTTAAGLTQTGNTTVSVALVYTK